jgi:hypothetical protein
VIRDRAAVCRASQRGRIEHVSDDHLATGSAQPPGGYLAARQRTDLDLSLAQDAHQVAANEPAATGDERLHLRSAKCA